MPDSEDMGPGNEHPQGESGSEFGLSRRRFLQAGAAGAAGLAVGGLGAGTAFGQASQAGAGSAPTLAGPAPPEFLGVHGGPATVPAHL